MNKSIDMTVPADCFAGIGEVWKGDYDCDRISFSGNPTVIDIGANIGAFAVWAMIRMKARSVISYEPNPTVFPYLKTNMEAFSNAFPQCHLEAVNSAVGNPEIKTLKQSNRSRMQCTQYELEGGEQTCEYVVNVLKPEDLPPCNILKIDCEGAEDYIVKHLQFTPDYLVLEYHSPEKMRFLMGHCCGDLNMQIVGGTLGGKVGMLKFAKI